MAGIVGLGQNSYFRWKAESSYGTAPTMTSAVLLPVLDMDGPNPTRDRIEKGYLSGSRIPKKPVNGRYVSGPFDVPMLMAPTLLGDLFSWALGAATSSGSGYYTHTWLCPVSGVRVGKSAAIEAGYGASDDVDQVNGVKWSGFRIEWDNQGDVKLIGRMFGKTYTTVARISTFTYPSVLDYNFSMVDFQVGAALGSVASVTTKGGFVDVDFGYTLDDYFAGDAGIKEPQFNTVPKVIGGITIDADTTYRGNARALDTKAAKLIITSTDIADGTTPYSTTMELPVLEWDADSGKVRMQNDRVMQDLTFTARGGVTTGSPSTAVPFEIQHVDATATHA